MTDSPTRPKVVSLPPLPLPDDPEACFALGLETALHLLAEGHYTPYDPASGQPAPAWQLAEMRFLAHCLVNTVRAGGRPGDENGAVELALRRIDRYVARAGLRRPLRPPPPRQAAAEVLAWRPRGEQSPAKGS
jgi:hypothetical protein